MTSWRPKNWLADFKCFFCPKRAMLKQRGRIWICRDCDEKHPEPKR